MLLGRMSVGRVFLNRMLSSVLRHKHHSWALLSNTKEEAESDEENSEERQGPAFLAGVVDVPLPSVLLRYQKL